MPLPLLVRTRRGVTPYKVVHREHGAHHVCLRRGLVRRGCGQRVRGPAAGHGRHLDVTDAYGCTTQKQHRGVEQSRVANKLAHVGDVLGGHLELLGNTAAAPIASTSAPAAPAAPAATGPDGHHTAAGGLGGVLHAGAQVWCHASATHARHEVDLARLLVAEPAGAQDGAVCAFRLVEMVVQHRAQFVRVAAGCSLHRDAGFRVDGVPAAVRCLAYQVSSSAHELPLLLDEGPLDFRAGRSAGGAHLSHEFEQLRQSHRCRQLLAFVPEHLAAHVQCAGVAVAGHDVGASLAERPRRTAQLGDREVHVTRALGVARMPLVCCVGPPPRLSREQRLLGRVE